MATSEAEEFEFRLRMEREAAGAVTTAPDRPTPSNLAVAGQAAAKGLAGVGDMFLNAPANLLNIGKYVAGDTMEKLGRPIWENMRVTEAPNLVQKGLTSLGVLSPEREPVTAGQRILDLAVQSGAGMAVNPGAGLVPALKGIGMGLASGAASGVTKEATGSDAAALAAGILVPMVLRGTAPSGTTTRQQTLKEAQAAGYVVPPSTVKPTSTTNKIESVAGKAAVRQEAAIRNQEITNKLAAESIGLPEGTPLTEGRLEQVREHAGKVYEKLRTLVPGGELRGLNVKTLEDRPMLAGPQTGIDVKQLKSKAIPERQIKSAILDERGAPIVKETIPEQPSKLLGIKIGTNSRGQDVPGPLQGMKVKVDETRGGSPVDELKQVRADAKVYYRHNNISGDPKSLKKANALMARATEIEDQLERAAVNSNQPELIAEFRAARTLIAKAHAIEQALNVGDGNVSARIIGRMLDQGKPLTGGLSIIGKFANAFPSVTREGAVIPASGVSGTDAAMSAMLGTAGYGAVGGPAGLVAAGAPLLRSPARSFLLSKPYQSRLLSQPVPLSQAGLAGALTGRSLIEQQ